MDLFLILHLHLSECVVFFLPQTLYYNNNNIDHIQFSRRAIVTISSRVNVTLSYSFSDYLVSFYDQFVLIKINVSSGKTKNSTFYIQTNADFSTACTPAQSILLKI